MAKWSAWIAGVAVAMILFCVAGGGGLVLARGRAGEGRAVMGADAARKEVEAFNRKFSDAQKHLKGTERCCWCYTKKQMEIGE
jgi:hypothetical protein